MRRLVKFVAGLFVLFAAIWVAFTVAMRAKFPPVQNAVRRMNRDVVNPMAMETAGQPGASASVIRHLGRTTATRYETPVQALATDDGFVIPLPYGMTADWLNNVLAAGSATIVHEGTTYLVDHPEIVPSAAADPFVPPKDQRTHRLFGIDEFLRVQRAEETETRGEVTAPA